jgi:DNA-binding NtrC family response regulator
MAETGKHPILVVDDEPEILFSLQGLLRLEFDVYTAPSGAAALEILHRQPVHVIMTDQRMPQMTGVELLKTAQGDCPEAVRILFTGYADIKAVIESINQGRVYRYLIKPWDPDDLLAVLHEACEEYSRIVERKRLLGDLRGHLGWALAQVAEPAFGPEVKEQFLKGGGPLLERLDRVLGSLG